MAPGSPLRLCATPPRAGGMLDAVARSSVQWPARDGRPLFPAPAGGTSALPLAGFRIVDFTMGWAGPLCTRTLADLGADIVKIESCSYPDWWRGVDRRPNVLREKLYEKTARFAVMNRNKRGVTIDLTRPEGVRLVKALVMHADAVVDNYSVDVLPKFGLGPDVLRALKPQLVTLSMSAFGSDSPWRECRAYGSTLEQGSGLPLLVGREDDVPVMGHPAYGDPIGGLSGAAALLTALLHARRTGEGQHIDLSQVECMMQMTAPWMIAHSLTGREPVRFGAGHPDYAPHGTYRCAGDDEWLLLAVTDDTQWQSLCALIGRADLAADPSLARAAQRRARADEIDVAIGAWTIQRSTEEAMMSLQGAGLAAGAVRRPADLLRDPHLLARGFWQSVERDYIGVQPQPSPAIREHEAPYLVRHPAPTLGESNADVFGSILGLSRQEIAALEDAGIIGTTLIIAEDKQLRRTSA
jgi:crotonobetainyl-CoA:carnitine CoA-transferase CaiB-like acyl-CoA transferase